MMTKALNKKRFFKWAREHEHEPVVTGKYFDRSNPIARFLNHETGKRTWTVCDMYLLAGKWHDMPDWAVEVDAIAFGCDFLTIGDLIKELRRQGVRP